MVKGIRETQTLIKKVLRRFRLRRDREMEVTESSQSWCDRAASGPRIGINCSRIVDLRVNAPRSKKEKKSPDGKQ